MTTSIVQEAPTLRYGWPTARLDEVASISGGFGFPIHFQGKTGLAFPFIKVSDLNSASADFVVSKSVHSVDQEALRKMGARPFPRGTVVFPKVGGALLTNKKRVLGIEAVADNNIMGIVPLRVESDWVFWWMQTIDLRTLANVQALPSIRQSVIAALRIPMPPKQIRIALAARIRDQVTLVEQGRVAAEAQSVAIGSLLESGLRAAFHDITPLSTGSSTATPPGWRWRRLLDLARLESGHTPSRKRPEWLGGEIPWIALPDIRRLDCREAHETLERTNDEGLANSSARMLPAGTVCLSRTASVGFVTILGREMATSQDFVNWVCGPELDPWFLLWALRASRNFIRSKSTGAIHKTVYLPVAQSFEICMPPLAEQQSIAARLHDQFSEIERARAAAAEQREAIAALPGAYLREAFAQK